jgi:hypothetical protein
MSRLSLRLRDRIVRQSADRHDEAFARLLRRLPWAVRTFCRLSFTPRIHEAAVRIAERRIYRLMEEHGIPREPGELARRWWGPTGRKPGR